jgi:hypothetical protein
MRFKSFWDGVSEGAYPRNLHHGLAVVCLHLLHRLGAQRDVAARGGGALYQAQQQRMEFPWLV